MSEKQERRLFLIDREMQTKFVMQCVAIMLLFTAVIAGTIIYSFNTFVRLDLKPETIEALRKVTLTVGIVMVLVLASVTCYFIYLSHKVAGPAYRLKRAVADLARGRYDTNVIMRKGDFLKDVASYLNHLVDRLKDREKRLGDVLERLDQLKQIQETGEGGSEQASLLAKEISDGIRSVLSRETGTTQFSEKGSSAK